MSLDPSSSPLPNPFAMSRKRWTILELIRAGHGCSPATHPTALHSPFSPSLDTQPAPTSATFPPPLDATTFPHIVDRLLLELGRDHLKILRAVHPSLRDFVDTATLISATLTPEGLLKTTLDVTLPIGLGNIDRACASRIRHLKTSPLTHGSGRLLGCVPPELNLKVLECEEHGMAVAAPLTVTTTRLFGPYGTECHSQLIFGGKHRGNHGSHFHSAVRAGLNPSIEAEEIVWVLEFNHNSDWVLSSLRGNVSLFPDLASDDSPTMSLRSAGSTFRFPAGVKRVKILAKRVPSTTIPVAHLDPESEPFMVSLARAIAARLDDITFTIVGDSWSGAWLAPTDLLPPSFDDAFTNLVAQTRAEMGKKDGLTHAPGRELPRLKFVDTDNTVDQALSEIIPPAWI